MFPYRAAVPKKDPEPEPNHHDFSSTQIQITGRPAEIIQKMARRVVPGDLKPEEAARGASSSATGIETDNHVTVKWGLHFQTPTKRMRDALQAFGPVKLTFGKTSLFRNDDADVLKVDINSPDLHRLNKLISKLSPTHDTHPTYIPHATIAYLKPGRGKKYTGDAALQGQSMTADSMIFSGKKGHRENLPLKPHTVNYRVKAAR